jgi:hypothetical protein
MTTKKKSLISFPERQALCRDSVRCQEAEGVTCLSWEVKNSYRVGFRVREGRWAQQI